MYYYLKIGQEAVFASCPPCGLRAALPHNFHTQPCTIKESRGASGSAGI
ncbi:MAG: hypothetical protein LUF32_02905 [Clostridiales bacterium]|nr:hypothetical protein [Clostridiales bacterium]